MPRPTALLVSPDRLHESLDVVRGLARYGLATVGTADVGEALRLIPRRAPQVVLLDLAAFDRALGPGEDGFALLRPIRFLTAGPILVAAQRDETAALRRALDLGADAPMLKPVDVELLVAGVAALQRRPALQQAPAPEVVRVRDLEVDWRLWEVRLRGIPVRLSPTEVRMIACLAANIGRVVPARQLVLEAQGYSCSDQEAQRIAKVNIRRLRAKLDQPADERPYIVNVRGLGYVLERRGVPHADDLLAGIAV
jgi:DNA-binding response OmpR family regulator